MATDTKELFQGTYEKAGDKQTQERINDLEKSLEDKQQEYLKLKQLFNQSKATIDEQNTKIKELEEEIEALQNPRKMSAKVFSLKCKRNDLKALIEQYNAEIPKLNDEYQAKLREIRKLKELQQEMEKSCRHIYIHRFEKKDL